MKSYYSIEQLTDELRPRNTRLVASIGLFDGVHMGHQHLINATIEMAHSLQAECLVVTMDRHPLSLLRPELPSPRTLCSLAQKEELIRALGVDHLLVLPFTHQLSALSATQFIRPLLECGLVGMMLGYDNRFGHSETGVTLQEFDKRLTQLGLQVSRVTPLLVRGSAVSSSHIRRLIATNRLEEAEALLGRPFSIVGKVEGGRKIGRTIGFPTANVIPYDPTLTLPEEGVYISEVGLEGHVYPAMSYYGSTPTITPQGKVINRVEAYLLGFEGNLYGRELEVGFRAFIRPDRRFGSLQELQQQLLKDVETTRNFFEQHPLTLKGTTRATCYE